MSKRLAIYMATAEAYAAIVAEDGAFPAGAVETPPTRLADVAFRLAVCDCIPPAARVSRRYRDLHELWCAKTVAARTVHPR